MKTKIVIKDLNTELMNLYYYDGSLNTFEMELFGAKTNFDKETGEEIGADLVLNTQVTPSFISPKIETEAGDTELSYAALCLFEDGLEYEADFGEMNTEVDYEFNAYITDAQKTVNFNFFMGKLLVANNFSKLKIVRESVLAGQKGEHGWFFFKKGDSAKFWDAYNLKKEALNKNIKKRSA
jgi:hypothetical protein